MNKLDWLLPWRAKRIIEDKDEAIKYHVSELVRLREHIVDLHLERDNLLKKLDKSKDEYRQDLDKIMADFKADHDQLNTALTQAYENNKYVLGQKFGLLDDEREALTKRAVDAETELKTQTANFKAEQRKVAAMTRWIKVAHRLDVPSTDNAIERILKEHQGSIAAIVIFMLFLLTGCAMAQQPPILRTFFDTNPAPIVEVVGGVGIAVTPSTPNVQTRRFAVDATGSTVASNVYGSNVIGAVAESRHATNSDYAIYATNWLGMDVFSNQVYLAMTNLNTYTSNQIHVDITNLNVYTSNALQQSTSNTVDYVSNILATADITLSNAVHVDMTNLNVYTSNHLQQSMSNTVGYVSNILYYSSTNFFQQNQYTTNFFRGFVVEPFGVSKGDVLCDQGAGFGIANGDTFVALADNANQDLLPVIGVAGENAAFGTYVTVVNVGDVWMDTSAFANGDYAYLDGNGQISAYPTDPNAVIVEIGLIAYAANPGILRVKIHPKYDGLGFTHQIPGNLQYILWNALGNPDSGSFFTARNGSDISMIGINSVSAPTFGNSQIINNSGIPLLFQIASNTAAILSTSSNLSVGWYGGFSGNGLGLTNLIGSIASFQGKGTNTTLYGDVNVTNAVVVGPFGAVLSNANGRVQISGGNITNSGIIMPTNGLLYQGKQSFYTNFDVVQNLQLYNCNGTNQLITLPNAATYPWQIFRFSMTNGSGSFILTNATGAQTIRDGTNLFLKQIGVGELAVYSDGAAWWVASKAKTVFPNASWSCSTNIPLVSAAGTSNILTLDTLEFNNSQGIALAGGYQSQIWITNSGQYFFTFSAVLSTGNAGDTNFVWIKQNGTNMPRTRTDVIVGKTGSISHQVVMTVNFIFNVTTPSFFQIVGRSSASGAQVIATGSDATMPSMPSLIVTVNRVSDTYP